MNLERFLERGTQTWQQLDERISAARGKPDRLGPSGIRDLGRLYRAAVADLALARRRWPGDPVTARLEDLVGRARPLVYASEARRESLLGFLTTGYWRLVRERPRLLALSALLLVGSAALSAIWALNDPGAALGLVPDQFRHAIEAQTGDRGLPVEAQAAFASGVSTNNIQVTFLAFAGGIAGGLGTAFVLAYNGTFLGAVIGLAFGSGNGSALVEFVVAHGILELTCIIVAATAGLRMGAALIFPGPGSRANALVVEARRAVTVVLGTAPWLVLAGLVEGFISPAGLGFSAVVGIGVSLGLVFWGLVLWRGAPDED